MARIFLCIIFLLAPVLAEERRLVVIHKGLLSSEAEVRPEFDYTVPRARRWTLEGDPAVIGLLGDGVKVRLRGDFSGTRVSLGNRIGTEPTALPVTGGVLWHGRLQATVVSQSPPVVQLESGIRAPLSLSTPQEQAEWARWSAAGRFTLEGNFIDGTLYDPQFSEPFAPAVSAGPFRVLCQMSEGFLDRCLQAYLAAHKSQLSYTDQSHTTRFEVSRMGATLLDCAPGQLRFFGQLRGQLFFQGQEVGNCLGEFELVVQPRFEQGSLKVQVVPNSLHLRMTEPLSLPVPADWAGALQALITSQLGSGVSLPVPGAYARDLEKSGVMSASDRFGVWTAPTGDRRTGFLTVAGPVVENAPGPNLMENRLGGQEFVVALSDEAINRALEKNIPGLLPIRRPIPKNLRLKQDILIFKLEVTEVVVTDLKMRYENGLFHILDSVINVHWKLAGIFQGDEPGARISGTAALLSGQGGHIKLKPTLESLTFLSKHITDRSPAEQEAIKAKALAGLSTLELDFLLPSSLPVPDLARKLELVDVLALPTEIRLLGRLSK